jgi:hypothetical protein
LIRPDWVAFRHPERIPTRRIIRVRGLLEMVTFHASATITPILNDLAEAVTCLLLENELGSFVPGFSFDRAGIADGQSPFAERRPCLLLLAVTDDHEAISVGLVDLNLDIVTRLEPKYFRDYFAKCMCAERFWHQDPRGGDLRCYIEAPTNRTK